MSRMVPVAAPLSNEVQLQLAGVTCAGSSCGFWAGFTPEFHFDNNGAEPSEVSRGACALVVIAGIGEEGAEG